MIAICLQYWSGDIERAARMARMIADIEPARREDVKFRFVARYDCDHVDLPTIQAVGRRFDVSWGRTEECDWTGWPAGPNKMATELIGTAEKWLAHVGWSACDGIFLIEPDVVPLRRTWLNEVLAEWAVAQAGGKTLMGSWRNSGGPHGHINGNCVIAPSVGRMAIWRHMPRHFAWDCHIAPKMRDHWHVSGLFRNDFEGKNATEELLRTPEVGDRAPAMVHGYKDLSAEEIARKWMNL